MDKKMLKSIFGGPLLQSGFKRKGPSWYRQVNDILQIVNLQKSDYAMTYYVNLGFLPDGMTIEGMPTPPEWKFPVRTRLDEVFPTRQEEVEQTFNLERNDISDVQWNDKLTDISQNLALTFMDSISDIKALCVAIEKGVFGMIDGTAVEFLGVDGPAE